jgi:hypothetical protein
MKVNRVSAVRTGRGMRAHRITLCPVSDVARDAHEEVRPTGREGT